MRILRMLVAAAIFSGAATANAEKASLVVTATDGSTTRIELCDGMRGAYFDEGNGLQLKITSGQFVYEGGQEVPDETSDNPGVVHLTMPVTRLDGLAFYGVDTSVEGIAADNVLTIVLEEGKLVFRGVTAPVELTVSSVDGRTESSRTITSDVEIDMAAYGSGIHLVKAGERMFKILVK